MQSEPAPENESAVAQSSPALVSEGLSTAESVLATEAASATAADEDFDLDAEVDGLVAGADVEGQAVEGPLPPWLFQLLNFLHSCFLLSCIFHADFELDELEN